MNTIIRITHLTILPLAVLALGCSSTSGPEPEAESQAPERVESTTQNGGSAAHAAAKEALGHVYFATDSATLEGEAREGLERWADAIVAHPEWGTITVEGHCDERGSDAYNEALGQRRAEAVARFLEKQGVAGSRLETRSYGSMEPSVAGHGERAWRYNRRSEIDLEIARTAAQRDGAERGLATNADL